MKIVLNNKCNFTKEEFKDYINKLEKLNSSNNLIICPSSIYLSSVSTNNIILGSQNVSKYEMGPHTGEVSAKQLKSLGVKYVLVGHHERIKECNETIEDIKQKIKLLLNENITPILCVGETKEERQNNSNDKLLKIAQLILSDLTTEDIKKIIIAYEPIWCIGTGLTPTWEEIEKTANLLKNNLEINEVLYGGSVNEETIKALKTSSKIDGYLLGELSLIPEKLEKFINILEN